VVIISRTFMSQSSVCGGNAVFPNLGEDKPEERGGFECDKV
jgi:hypothetical protein